MNAGGLAAPLKGDFEDDETYVGGKRDKGGRKSKPGRGTKIQLVMALVECNGKATTRVIPNVCGAKLRKVIWEAVDRDSRTITDEWGGHKGVGKEFAGRHATVTHSAGRYVKFDAHTNTAESLFALLKRGIVGARQSFSKRHLRRYCDEFEFRWNHRKVSDHECMLAAISNSGGKRLTYK